MEKTVLKEPIANLAKSWSIRVKQFWQPAALGLAILLTQSPAARAATDAVGGGWLQGGALGQYYTNTTFSGTPAFTRRDVRVDFTWGSAGKAGGSRSPGYAAVGNQNFSVRWTGQIQPRFGENYTFKLVAGNTATLYIQPTNSVTWTALVTAASGNTNTAATNLVAGQVYNLKLEYSQTTGTPICRLLWSSASTPEEVLDTATVMGRNMDVYETSLWANAMDGGRDEWAVYNAGTLVPRDTNGWPMTDATNIVFEGYQPNQGAGSYFLQFQGKAAVYAYDFNNCSLSVNGTSYGGNLPFGTGYNATSNLTTATLTLYSNAPGGILYLGFYNSRRNPTDTTNSGVTNVKLMRPVTPGSTNSCPLGSYFYPPIETALQRYTLLRFILNADTDTEWNNRPTEKPSYSTHVNIGNQRYWEQMVMLANECGKDLYVCLPVQASDDYLTNVANLIRYGSDGVNPYTSAQANPVYPPLNPNLRVILEHENEVWNFGFPNFGYNVNMLLQAYTNNTPDWQIVNYDGAYSSNPSGAWLRWHILRGLRASDIFRSVFGDAAMGSRVRPIYEYQYDDANGTASGALTFVDNYFNNADGTAHVATPYPVNHYFWGGGAAVYYASGNSSGTQTNIVFANSGFETPALASGQVQTNPPGSSWTFTGAAGIYSAVATTNAWNLGTASLAGAGNTLGNAVGCQFTVGNSPIAVYQLGRWVVSGNSQSHNLWILDTNGNTIAQTSVNTQGAAINKYVYGQLSTTPLVLAAHTTYYLLSEENSDQCLDNSATVTPVAGLTVNNAVTATFGNPSWNTSLWTFDNTWSGSPFGPVNLLYAPAAEGILGYPPNPPSGSQALFIQSTGMVSQVVNFTSTGTYALSFQSAVSASVGTGARFFFDNTEITGNGSLATGPSTNATGWWPGSFGVSSTTFNSYATYVFEVTTPGTHTLTIKGTGQGQFGGAPAGPNPLIYFDNLQIASADALFAGGIPGAGQAFGQVASANYSAQLYSQARYVQAYGLQVVAYEGGWSLGGDFGATPFQNWCKYFDPRSATAQLSSINTFAQSGGRYYCSGTYEDWPQYDTPNAGSYPLVYAVDTNNNALPVLPLNGLNVPNVLTPANSKWLITANSASGVISATGGWFDWNILAPVSGNFVIAPSYQSAAGAVMEVDGSVVSAGTTVTNYLTQGLHAIKVRSTSGSFTVTNVVVSQLGAPNAPSLQSAVAGVGNNALVTLNWSPAASGAAAQGYLVYYGTASASYGIPLAVGNVTNYTVTGLSNGVTAYFAVVATSAQGYSLPSNELNATPVAPGQIQNLLVWDFFAAGGNAANDGNVSSVAATATASGMLASTITRGAGSPAGAIQNSPGEGCMNLNSPTSWTAASLAAAVTANSYFQFAVRPAAGNRFSLSQVSYVTYQQNSHSSATTVLQYSANNTPWVSVATNNPVNFNWAGTTNAVSLAGISALQNATNVNFRIYGFGFTSYEDKGLGEVPGNNPDVAVVGAVYYPVATPTFSPAGGTYNGSQSVTISTTTTGSSIRYTTDGSTPTSASGTLYTGPVTVSANTTLQAIAYQTNFIDSAVASASYVINGSQPVNITLQMSGANLQLTWPQGTLLQATNLTGPWVTNLATSPYLVSPTNSRMFYRIRVQ